MYSKTKAIAVSQVSLVSQKVRDFGELVKFKLNLTVVFSAVMAYLIAATGQVNWLAVSILGLGGFCVAGAANALNQVLERDFDKLMKRTANRPVAAGRMSISEAVLTAGLLSIAGLTLLALFNPWASFFGVVAMLSYAFLYTPMKRISPAAIAVGAFPRRFACADWVRGFSGRIDFAGLGAFCDSVFLAIPAFRRNWLARFRGLSKSRLQVCRLEKRGA